jgi:hypothetical protein
MKVSELTGAMLDLLVAKAEGLTARLCNDKSYVIVDKAPYCPSTNPDTGHRIIEREHISIRWDDETVYGEPQNRWLADIDTLRWSMEGPTSLIAAMRAFVAARFGADVQLD